MEISKKAKDPLNLFITQPSLKGVYVKIHHFQESISGIQIKY